MMDQKIHQKENAHCRYPNINYIQVKLRCNVEGRLEQGMFDVSENVKLCSPFDSFRFSNYRRHSEVNNLGLADCQRRPKWLYTIR
jgi:hypothetical protein